MLCPFFCVTWSQYMITVNVPVMISNNWIGLWVIYNICAASRTTMHHATAGFKGFIARMCMHNLTEQHDKNGKVSFRALCLVNEG